MVRAVGQGADEAAGIVPGVIAPIAEKSGPHEARGLAGQDDVVVAPSAGVAGRAEGAAAEDEIARRPGDAGVQPGEGQVGAGGVEGRLHDAVAGVEAQGAQGLGAGRGLLDIEGAAVLKHQRRGARQAARDLQGPPAHRRRSRVAIRAGKRPEAAAQLGDRRRIQRAIIDDRAGQFARTGGRALQRHGFSARPRGRDGAGELHKTPTRLIDRRSAAGARQVEDAVGGLARAGVSQFPGQRAGTEVQGAGGRAAGLRAQSAHGRGRHVPATT